MPVALPTAEAIWDGSLVHGRGTVESGSGALTDLPVTWAARTEAPGRKDEPRGVGCRRARDVLQHGTRARARGSEDTACTQATSASCVLDEVDGARRIASAALRVHAQVEVLGEAGFNGAVGQAAALCPVSAPTCS
jgi:osmotically inducible protein OsmC